MEVTLDPAQIIVASTGFVALVTGLRQKKRSQTRQDRIESARQELDRRESTRKDAIDANLVKDGVIATLEARHERDQAEIDRLRNEIDKMRDRVQRWMDERQAQFDADLAHERSAREAERQMAREELQHAHEDVAAMAALVRGQAEAVAAGEDVPVYRAHLVSDTSTPPALPVGGQSVNPAPVEGA